MTNRVRVLHAVFLLKYMHTVIDCTKLAVECAPIAVRVLMHKCIPGMLCMIRERECI